MAKRIRAASGVSTGKADPVRKAIRLSLVTAVERCMSSHIGRPRANSGYSEQEVLTRLSDFMAPNDVSGLQCATFSPGWSGSTYVGPMGGRPFLAMAT
jgi:hypothetical protein